MEAARAHERAGPKTQRPQPGRRFARDMSQRRTCHWRALKGRLGGGRAGELELFEQPLAFCAGFRDGPAGGIELREKFPQVLWWSRVEELLGRQAQQEQVVEPGGPTEHHQNSRTNNHDTQRLPHSSQDRQELLRLLNEEVSKTS